MFKTSRTVKRVPSRLQLPQCCGVRGLCAFLRGDRGTLLSVFVRDGARGGVRLLPRLPLPVLPHVPAGALPKSRDLQKSAPLPGGVHGDPDVYRLHPGEGAAAPRTERFQS